MINTSPLSWIAMLAIILLASVAGYVLSRRLPWLPAARAAGAPGVIGFSLGPFLLGVFTILALGFLPGHSHAVHMTVVIGGLLILVVAGLFLSGGRRLNKLLHVPTQPGVFLFSGLLVLWVVLLLVNSIFLPLLQNDALEYATVARLLYETRDLASYPALHPEQSTSGFFGPWTHPPLYVALGYFTQVIQGHANEPGFMRLIAPWFAICSTLLIVALGSLVSRLAGLISGVLFLSTPLFFAGANSALLDALPVLGIALIAALLICIEAKPSVRGLLAGCVAGLALWTHSQAILFLPLALTIIVLQNGMTRWRISVIEAAGFCAAAFALGAWWYLRNLSIFGSIISDNPADFALPVLDWPAYFSYARGLNNWAAIIQYGLFKGWFSLEAFGWVFWLMLPGMVVGIKHACQPTLRATFGLGGRQALAPEHQLLWVSIALVAAYLAGVLVSIFAGLDLMIKNERYMLVILPFASLLGGYILYVALRHGVMFIINHSEASIKKYLLILLIITFIIFLIMQLIGLGVYYRWQSVPDKIIINEYDLPEVIEYKQQEIDKPVFQRHLEHVPNMALMIWARENLPEDALVLSLRPADMYYARRKMVSYLDERMLPVYRERSPLQAVRTLRDLDITHLHIPNYGLPVGYNSVIDQIVADPSLTQLIRSVCGTQILRLLPTSMNGEEVVVLDKIDFTPGRNDWRRYINLILGGRKALGALPMFEQTLTDEGKSSVRWAIPLLHRDFSTIIVNGYGTPLSNTSRSDVFLSVRGGAEYRVTFDLEGDAFVKLWMIQIDDNNKLLSCAPLSLKNQISEFVLSESNKIKNFSRRFITLPDAVKVRFAIEHLGHSRIRIRQALLEHLNNL